MTGDVCRSMVRPKKVKKNWGSIFLLFFAKKNLAFLSQISPKPPNIVSIRRIHTNSRLFIRFYAHKGSFSGVVLMSKIRKISKVLKSLKNVSNVPEITKETLNTRVAREIRHFRVFLGEFGTRWEPNLKIKKNWIKKNWPNFFRTNHVCNNEFQSPSPILAARLAKKTI